MERKEFKKVIITIIIIIIVIISFFNIRNIVIQEPYDMSVWLAVLFTTLVTISITAANAPFFVGVKPRFPLRINLFKKLFFTFFITSVIASVIITIWVLIFYIVFRDYVVTADTINIGLDKIIFENIATAVIVNFSVGAIWVLRYSIIGWKKAFVEAEEYKRKSIESQYSALVNQINPHFLFNSMNALASLIPQSPEKAVEFVNKFSKIYRYVLDVKDKVICGLKDEIDFLDSYCYLQKIRFGENLIIEKSIETECLSYFLPPLSLQLLVENAIKHNEISALNPLKILIESNGKSIIVRNNLKFKISEQQSPGIGLQNLKERYHHLTNIKPQFYIKNNEYIAKIPFITEE